MKKIAALLLVLLSLSLSGCMSEQDIPEKIAGTLFTADITLVWREQQYTGSLSRPSEGELELSVSGHELFEPLVFAVKDNGFTAKSVGLEYTVSLDDAPADCPAVRIYEALQSLKLGKAENQGEQALAKSPMAELIYNKSDGSYISLKLPEGEVVFNSFKRLK